jgi:hypothetical protein
MKCLEEIYTAFIFFLFINTNEIIKIAKNIATTGTIKPIINKIPPKFQY